MGNLKKLSQWKMDGKYITQNVMGEHKVITTEQQFLHCDEKKTRIKTISID